MYCPKCQKHGVHSLLGVKNRKYRNQKQIPGTIKNVKVFCVVGRALRTYDKTTAVVVRRGGAARVPYPRTPRNNGDLSSTWLGFVAIHVAFFKRERECGGRL